MAGENLLTQLDRCVQLQDDLPELAAFKGGRKIGQIGFIGERRVAVSKITGEGLNGRLAYDLAEITPESLRTSNDEHFIRTRIPDGLDYSKRDPWIIRIGGLVKKSIDLTLEELERETKEKGTFVMECSGNSSGRAFGLLSAASWSGAAVTDLLDRVAVDSKATQVLISGFDQHSIEPGSGIERNSTLGASWVFSFDDLKNTGAFLATRMNGEPLPKDHGFPVRLIVPGWYGCTCAKWIDNISLVDDDFPSTNQMREFSSRTHQTKQHKLAKDFQPAEMDLAAMPIRIERWKVDGQTIYKIAGILWGGKSTTDKLMIRLGKDNLQQRVESYSHRQNATWTLWQHTWKPDAIGDYEISLSVDDQKIRTRRLNRGYYDRSVKIENI